MNEINTLLTQHSAGEIIFSVIIVLFVLRTFSELFAYFWEKIKKYFHMEKDKEEWKEQIMISFNNIEEDLKKLYEQNKEAEIYRKKMDEAVMLIQERLQENTRSYIIDKHHKFVYEVGGIDDLNLQAMERRYLYYKTAGGNTFIDQMMDEVRELPRITSFTNIEKAKGDRKDFNND